LEENSPTETNSSEGSGLKLAIDYLLDVVDKKDSEEIVKAVEEPIKTKKKRNSRYKNLAYD
jgi:hypothetical protein